MLESIIGQELARPRFVKVDDLIENGFTRRCLGTIIDSWQERESRVIAAVPFSGKSRLLKHLIVNSGAYKDDSIEETRMPLIGVVAPKSRTEAALGNKITSELGALVNMTWAQRREWLFQALIRVQSEMLVIDDAQDLSLEQLRYLKEIYDTLMLKGLASPSATSAPATVGQYHSKRQSRTARWSSNASSSAASTSTIAIAKSTTITRGR